MKHQTLNWELRSDIINKLVFNLANPGSSLAFGDINMVYMLTHNTKRLQKIELPNEPPKKVKKMCRPGCIPPTFLRCTTPHLSMTLALYNAL